MLTSSSPLAAAAAKVASVDQSPVSTISGGGASLAASSEATSSPRSAITASPAGSPSRSVSLSPPRSANGRAVAKPRRGSTGTASTDEAGASPLSTARINATPPSARRSLGKQDTQALAAHDDSEMTPQEEAALVASASIATQPTPHSVNVARASRHQHRVLTRKHAASPAPAPSQSPETDGRVASTEARDTARSTKVHHRPHGRPAPRVLVSASTSRPATPPRSPTPRRRTSSPAKLQCGSTASVESLAANEASAFWEGATEPAVQRPHSPFKRRGKASGPATTSSLQHQLEPVPATAPPTSVVAACNDGASTAVGVTAQPSVAPPQAPRPVAPPASPPCAPPKAAWSPVKLPKVMQGVPVPLGVSAQAWAIADASTGDVLWGHNHTVKRRIASLTKMTTLVSVLQLARSDPSVLDEVLTVSEASAKTIGTSARLRAGDRAVVADVLRGMMLPSGNDAARSLAEHFGPRIAAAAAAKSSGDGSSVPAVTVKGKAAVDAFVQNMHVVAAGVGATNTVYANPHGLDSNDGVAQHSTAADVAAIASAGLKDPKFAEIVHTKKYTCTMYRCPKDTSGTLAPAQADDGAETNAQSDTSTSSANADPAPSAATEGDEANENVDTGSVSAMPKLAASKSASPLSKAGREPCHEHVKCDRHAGREPIPQEWIDDGATKTEIEWENSHRLLGSYRGFEGVKTGVTYKAGPCLCTSARRGSKHLIVVLLSCKSKDARYTDTLKLTRWAWKQLGIAQRSAANRSGAGGAPMYRGVTNGAAAPRAAGRTAPKTTTANTKPIASAVRMSLQAEMAKAAAQAEARATAAAVATHALQKQDPRSRSATPSSSTGLLQQGPKTSGAIVFGPMGAGSGCRVAAPVGGQTHAWGAAK